MGIQGEYNKGRWEFLLILVLTGNSRLILAIRSRSNIRNYPEERREAERYKEYQAQADTAHEIYNNRNITMEDGRISIENQT